MDATTTKAVIASIVGIGYAVQPRTDDDGNVVAQAANSETAERFIVRGSDLYDAVCELAQQVGIELEDG